MNLAGLREDGRRAGELRQIAVKLGLGGSHDGSCYLEMGQTRVMAQVYGPHEVDGRYRLESQDRCVINVEYAPAPFAGLERKRRRVGDRQGVELALAVRQCLEAAVVRTAHAQQQLDVCLTVLQDDGGRLEACLNAAGLAVMDAGVAMTDFVVASSAGFLKGPSPPPAAVDMTNREKAGGGAFLPVAVLPRTEEVVLCQMDAKLPLDQLEPLLALAVQGALQVHSVFRDAVQHHTELLLAARHALAHGTHGDNDEGERRGGLADDEGDDNEEEEAEAE